MNKVLVAILASGLTAGLSTSAVALDFQFSGGYTIEGYYLSATDGAGFDLTTDGAGSDAFYAHTFQILTETRVNDPITVHGDFRLADDTVWGADDTPTLLNGSARIFDIHKIFMDYDSPLGRFRVGRTPAGLWYGDFLNTDTHGNRIMWWPNLLPEAWGLLLYTEKVEENDDNSETTDQDTDRYHLGISHQGDRGLGAVAYDHYRVAATDSGYGELQIFGDYTFGKFSLQVEAHHKFGDDQADTAVDYDAWAAVIEINYRVDNLEAGLTYFYASGDDEGSASDNEAFFGADGGLGEDFQPLYILTGYYGGILNEHVGATSVGDDGVHGYGFNADYQLAAKLTLHAALGYAEVDREPAGSEKDLGWEFNLGAAYNLLDNLVYEARFGYLAGGDYFRNGADDAEDVTLVSHHLAMVF